MNKNWLKRHWWRIAIYTTVTTAMMLHYGSLIPAWIFYALLIALHIWIFSRIGVRVYRWKQNRNN